MASFQQDYGYLRNKFPLIRKDITRNLVASFEENVWSAKCIQNNQ